MIENRAQTSMPKYRCHKEVYALKIQKVEFDGDATYLIPENKSYGKIEVDLVYKDKHKPIGDGYYVVYMDGYKSWSPSKAFEEGYELIGKESK